MGACQHPCSGSGNIPQYRVVITFKRVDIKAPFDLVTNRIRSMPSDAGKRQSRGSVLSFCICLTRIINQILKQFFATLLLLYFSHLLWSTKTQNRLSLWFRKSSILSNSVAAGGGRNQLSSERFIIFIIN